MSIVGMNKVKRNQKRTMLLTLYALVLHIKCTFPCDKKFTAESGTLVSDDTRFKDSTTCIWEISVPTGYRIELTVHFAQINSCCSCNKNYVEFRDGLGSNSTKILRYCGNEKPKVYSSQNSLTVQYSFTKGPLENVTMVNKFKAHYQTICGKYTESKSGIINLPPFSNLTCDKRFLITILAPHNHWVKMTFTNFTLKTSDDCLRGFVMVKDTALVEMNSNSQKLLLCGKLTSFYIFSKGSALSLLYQASLPFSSYITAEYKATNESVAPCGGVFTGTAGYIYSYGYPKPFPKHSQCVWKIEVPHGYVQLKFVQFNFHSGTWCKKGKVEVYDGWSSNSMKIWNDCTSRPEYTSQKSQSNRLLINATSANKEVGTFVLFYKLVKEGLCSQSKFSCTSRECVDRNAVCDGVRDCIDGSDEINCPKNEGKSLYILWAFIVFIVTTLMIVWLWRTWRKAVHRTVHINSSQCPEADDHASDVPSQSGAPPTYSEALEHNPARLPSYEEALLNENGGVVLEQGNTVRFHAQPNRGSCNLLLRCDRQRRHGRTRNSRQRELGIV